MVSVKLNKYVFQTGETVTVYISDIRWFVLVTIKVINKGKEVYNYTFINFWATEVTHSFNATSDMLGQNTLRVEIYWNIFGGLEDATETYFTVYSLGGGDGGGGGGSLLDSIIRTIIQLITQYPYILLILAIPLILLKRKK